MPVVTKALVQNLCKHHSRYNKIRFDFFTFLFYLNFNIELNQMIVWYTYYISKEIVTPMRKLGYILY